MNTRRHPRTMQEAFGPYTDSTIYEPSVSYPWTWWALVAACALVGVAVIVVTA